MNGNIGIGCLTFALILAQAPDQVIGHEPTLIRRSIDRLSEDPVIVKVVVLNETASFALDLKAEDFLIEENGERQKPTRLLRQEQPLSIGSLANSNAYAQSDCS